MTIEREEARAKDPAEHRPSSAEAAAMIEVEIPAELPILPMRNVTLFPGITAPVVIGREGSVRLIDEVWGGEKFLGLVAQRDPTEERPRPEGL